jgi:hypothetical protein
MHWKDIADVVKDEEEKGNPIASVIVDLKLDVGKITLRLPLKSAHYSSENSDSDDEEPEIQLIDVDVDIYQSAFANARSYFGAKKVAAVKSEKTVEASQKAFKTAEQKIMASLQKKQSAISSITKQRQSEWYEKFNWFISTENKLILSGKDLMQSEQLLVKYFKPGDWLVHCDMEDSIFCIVKRIDREEDIIGSPTASLLQAGTMVLCNSKPWLTKTVTSAYWVHHHQVSKIDVFKSLIPQGKFMINGQKNYLPPVQLIYGVGLLFQVSNSDIERHAAERRPWLRGEQIIEQTDQSMEKLNRALDLLDVQVSEPVQELLSINSNPAPTTSKKSAKDRRQQKKGNENSGGTLEKNESQNSINSVSSEKSKQTPRGSRAKNKRSKKYADEDDEAWEKSVNKSKASIEGKDRIVDGEGEMENAKCDNGESTQTDDRIEQTSIRKPTTKPSVVPGNEAKILEEGAAFVVPPISVDNLTSLPHSEDTIMGCVVMSAPWITLQRFKYKIKLIPGSLKRGKAAQQVLNEFQKFGELSEQEKEALSNVNENEVLSVMINKVKVVTSKNK